MNTTAQNTDVAAATPPPLAGELRLEVLVIPVSDVDLAKSFYIGNLGWRLDADFTVADGLSVVQVTPPGSPAAVIFGAKITTTAPGTLDGMLLAVHDIEQARADLLDRGVEVSGVFHDIGGAFHHGGEEGRVPGPDPSGNSYGSWASFQDPDGNRWFLQEIHKRQPGR